MTYFDGSGASSSDEFFRRRDEERAQAEINRMRAENAALLAEIERLRAVERLLREAERKVEADAAAIATIAHSGGLTGLSEAEALVAIRLLTLRAWDRTGTVEQVRDRVRAALEGKR